MKLVKRFYSLSWTPNDFMELIRILTFLMATAILIFGLVAYTNATNNNQRQLAAIHSLATQNKQLSIQNKQLSDQNAQLLQKLNSGVDSLHSQINCVLEFFAQNAYTRANTTISDPNQCVISSSGGTAVPKPQGATNAPTNNPRTSAPAPEPAQPNSAHAPRQNFIQRLIHKVAP